MVLAPDFVILIQLSSATRLRIEAVQRQTACGDLDGWSFSSNAVEFVR